MDIVKCLLIGGLSGVIAALCGVGGGVILVPAFVMFLGLEQKTAVATSLTAIILTSLAATIRNSGNNLVDFKVAIPTAIGSAALAWFAADYLKQLSNATLSRIFAVLLIVVGIHMLLKKEPTPAPSASASPSSPSSTENTR